MVRGPRGWSEIDTLVDTGATFCILPSRMLVALGYDLNNPVRWERIAGVTAHTLPLFEVETVKALGFEVQGCQVGVFDLPDEAPVNALLGLSFLRHFRLTLDLPRGLLELAASEPINTSG